MTAATAADASAANWVALLGTKGGPAIRTGSTNPTSTLLSLQGQMIVVDCGLGVTRGLVDQGMALANLSRIFITHLHSDHYLELGPLLHTAWTAGLKTPVDVWGPAGLADYWAGFLTAMAPEIDLRIEDEGRPDLRALVRIHLIDGPEVMAAPDLRVRAMRNVHPPFTNSFALRFETASHHVVLSGDTAFYPPLATFAQEADLLVHEAMLSAGVEALIARVGNTDDRLRLHLMRSHSLAEEAARIATMARVRALALHHLIPSDDPAFTEADWIAAVRPHWQGPLYVGRDGLRIALPD